MKSARERAESLADASVDSLGYPRHTTYWKEMADVAEAMFREHARDQRAACADVIMRLELCGECPEASTYTRDDAYNAVLATPAPGES